MIFERFLLNKYLEENPKILNDHLFKQKIINIPHYFTPEYTVDFGCVILENPVCYTILITNYGPEPTNIVFLKDPKMGLEAKEFKFEYKNRILQDEEVMEFYILFCPTEK